jgi:NAD(P)-dependent dehydrogenase (short-subunit alcohol dehydrogenase family)
METSTDRPLAVVTGASSGIGFELAKQFGHHGFDLIVAAEYEDIHAAANRLATHGALVIAVQADLAEYDGVEQLVRWPMSPATASRR